MGSNNQGVVWNDTDFPIEYVIYGNFAEEKDEEIKTTISPEAKITVSAESAGIQVKGFTKECVGGFNNKFGHSYVEVPPGRFITSGLSNLEMNKHKISIRVKVGQFEKYILRDIVVKALSDITLKIRSDFSVKNMTEGEAKQVIQKNGQRSLLVPTGEQIQKRKQKYTELLNGLLKAHETAEKKIQAQNK